MRLGIGLSIPLLLSLGIIDEPHHRVLDMTPEQQTDIVKLLVRYRVARKAPQFTPEPCLNGAAYCIRTTSA